MNKKQLAHLFFYLEQIDVFPSGLTWPVNLFL